MFILQQCDLTENIQKQGQATMYAHLPKDQICATWYKAHDIAS